jgi:hypothetical protein
MELNREFFKNWVDGLKEVWLKKDLDGLEKYFKNTKNYYETPFSEPVKNINDIKDLWKEIKGQEIEDLTFKVIAIENNIGIVNWFLKDQSGIYDGIYLIKFDKNLNCIEFKQWCAEKTE